MEIFAIIIIDIIIMMMMKVMMIMRNDDGDQALDNHFTASLSPAIRDPLPLSARLTIIIAKNRHNHLRYGDEL